MSADEPGQKHRKVYGKGFVDGMKHAAKEAGMSLSAVREKELAQGLSGIERKVYESLAIQEPMSVGDVVGEMARTTGSRPDFRIVAGCLEKLVERGLARRGGVDKYQREPVKDRPAPAKLEVVKPSVAVEKTPEDNLDAIMRLSVEVVELLGQIESHAKAIEAEKDRAAVRNEKAARLAELLKDFNG